MIFAGCGKEKAKEAFPQEEKSCLIEEDSDYLYLCGSYQLLKLNKATGESTVLWENKKDFEGLDYRLYSDGQGFLFGDRIYFIEAYRDEELGSEFEQFFLVFLILDPFLLISLLVFFLFYQVTPQIDSKNLIFHLVLLNHLSV